MCQIDCSFKSRYERHLKTMKHKHQVSIHSLMADVDDGDTFGRVYIMHFKLYPFVVYRCLDWHIVFRLIQIVLRKANKYVRGS